MTPGHPPLAAPSPYVVQCRRVPPRRVHVSDPAGRSSLRGFATLHEEHTLGDHLWGCGVAFAGGVTATVPPSWVSDAPAPQGNVVPFPSRRTPPCR